jgi:WD40 repeat protein
MGGGMHGHSSTVTAMAATKDERVVISGSKSGEVIVWAWQPDMAVTSNPQLGWHVRKQRCDHEAMVSFIYISEDMGMYLTSSFDGSASLYNLHSDVHLRTFHHPQLAPLHSALLTSTPLPAMCMFSRDDHHWYSYSLNNPYHLLEKQREDSCSHIIAPLVLKDAHSMDRLVYGTEKGYLVFRSLPLLKQLKKQQVSQRHPVLSLCCSPDRRFLMIGCGDGGLNVVTEPYNVAPPQQ